jgi:hypothetical protein
MKVVDMVPFKAWEEIALRCDYATFFHTPYWAKIMSTTYPRAPIATKQFVFDDGVDAIFPLIDEAVKGLMSTKHKLRSMTPGVYGGMIAPARLKPDHLAEALAYLTSLSIHSVKVVGNPFCAFSAPSSFRRKEMFTQMINLKRGFDAIWKSFPRGQKSNIRQAEKKGVQIRLATSREDYQAYFRIYRETLKRWGKSGSKGYPLKLFLNCLELGHDHVKLWLAEKDSHPLAGILTFSWNDNIIYWHGCCREDSFKYYPNNLLHVTVIQKACEEGYRVYDLNPSGGHEGVVRFKQSFGAETVSFYAYHWKNH